MIDTSPSLIDGKWYTHAEAVERQEQLIKTMPTGTGWYWLDRNGNAVVFSGKSKAKTQEHKPNRAERRRMKGNNVILEDVDEALTRGEGEGLTERGQWGIA